MPEEKTVDNIPDGDAHTQDGSAPAKDNADESLFDNMTAEELKALALERDKQYKELHGKMGQMSGELGELRNLRKELESENKLASVLDTANRLVAEKDKKPEFDYEAWEAQLLEEAQENPGEAMKKFMRANSSWSAQDKAELKKKFEDEWAEIKAHQQRLDEAYQTTTDDYKENKELIEKFRSKGMSIADAKDMAKEVRDMMPAELRPTPPSGIDPTRTVIPDRKATKPWTEDEVKAWEAEGRSEAFIENMKWKRERDAGLTEADKENF